MGEVKLWAAVLHQAARELAGITNDRCLYLREIRKRSARAWIESDDRGAGAFLWIADVIGVDGPRFRRRLLGLADRKTAGTSDKGRVASVRYRANARKVFGGLSSENKKAAL